MRNLPLPALVAVLVGATAAVTALVVGVVALLVVVSVNEEESPGAGDSPSAEQSAPGGESTTPAAPGATEPPRPALEPYYTQELSWEPCRSGYECATMEVPLDYAEPEEEGIEIALLRVSAREPDQRVGSMVVNPGGPGAPGTDYAAQSGRVFGSPLLDRFDIVGFDPRGTGRSTAVDCLTDQRLDDYLAQDPDPDTAAEREEYATWNRRMGQGCAEKSGELAAHVTTQEAARDMDVLRAVLGDRALNYFGASYGTKLGATYAELFPDRVGRFVLDGAVDPTLDNRAATLQQAEGFETALRAYVSNCVEEGDCFLGDSVEQGLQRIADLLEQVDQQPLPTGSDRQLRAGNAFYGIVTPLYNRDYWMMLDQALQAAFDGDGSALLQLSDLYSSRGEDGYTDNSAEAIYAINCLDDSSAIAPDQVSEELDAFRDASPTFGRIFAWSLTTCNQVQAERTVPERRLDAEGAAPMLVIGTTRDPATPMRWARALAEQLDPAVLVEREGDGHTGYNQGNDCVDSAVESYLIEGTVPDGPLRC